MGPEPESSGKRKRKAVGRRGNFDFNGAGAGKLRKTIVNGCGPGKKGELQWGRSRKAPENPGRWDVRPYRLKTSMGPEPESSGKLLGRLTMKVRDNKLQWGRSRKAPENYVRHNNNFLILKNFNGAGAGKLRKTSVSISFCAAMTSLQWGRSRKAPENCPLTGHNAH